jgi:cell wall-associated NlpC family hydrolase
MPFVPVRYTESPTACRTLRALALLVLGTALSLPLSDRAQAQDARLEGATTVVAEAAAAAPQSLADRALSSAQELAMQAIGMIGIRYTFGGRNPDTGFDCSGLVRYVFDRVTGRSLPHNSFEMARMGTSVSQDELQAGDLVFFNTRGQRFSHVGIYVGEGRFIHAPSRGGRVHIVNMGDRYWVSRFNGARRLAV